MPKVFFFLNFRLLLHKSFNTKCLKPKDTEISAVKKGEIRKDPGFITMRPFLLHNIDFSYIVIHCLVASDLSPAKY